MNPRDGQSLQVSQLTRVNTQVLGRAIQQRSQGRLQNPEVKTARHSLLFINPSILSALIYGAGFRPPARYVAPILLEAKPSSGVCSCLSSSKLLSTLSFQINKRRGEIFHPAAGNVNIKKDLHSTGLTHTLSKCLPGSISFPASPGDCSAHT